jgi:aminoglycoside N3'-acetyltransferase/glycosyltransferase involved in cell wall biosynthesis
VPVVSILMPVYNREDFLRMAISSVLKEEFGDFELLICDDGSSDGSLGIIKAFAQSDGRIKYFAREKNSGRPAVIYKFLADHASGRYLIASDSDDLALPNRLRILVGMAELHPDASVVYGKTRVVRRAKKIRSPFYYGRDFNQFDLFNANFVPDGAALIRKSIYDSIGGYNPEVNWAEDYDLRLRLAMEGPFVYVKDLVYIYYLHGRSWTARKKHLGEEYDFKSGIIAACRRHLEMNNILDNYSYKTHTALSYCAASYYSTAKLKREKKSRFSHIIKTVFKTRGLLREDELKRSLAELGIRSGQAVVVHGALSSFGSLEGGAHTVIKVLKVLISGEGLILMPAFTYETAYGNIRPDRIRKSRSFYPGFPVSKPIGAIAETFRKSEGVSRNFHPQLSFCFWGKEAASLSQKYHMSDSLSENSPLGEILSRDGYVLLLGTEFDTVSLLHTAEYLANVPYCDYKSFYGYKEDSQHLVAELRTTGHSGEFRKIAGLLFLGKVAYTSIRIGGATCHLIKARELVHWAVEFLKKQPDFFLCGSDTCVTCKDRRAFLPEGMTSSLHASGRH